MHPKNFIACIDCFQHFMGKLILSNFKNTINFQRIHIIFIELLQKSLKNPTLCFMVNSFPSFFKCYSLKVLQIPNISDWKLWFYQGLTPANCSVIVDNKSGDTLSPTCVVHQVYAKSMVQWKTSIFKTALVSRDTLISDSQLIAVLIS